MGGEAAGRVDGKAESRMHAKMDGHKRMYSGFK